jgi:hypothetical protein
VTAELENLRLGDTAEEISQNVEEGDIKRKKLGEEKEELMDY